MQEIVVATGNQGKLKEIREVLADLPVTISSLKEHFDPVPDIPEEGDTFAENAMAKADWVFSRKQIWTLADDSGLEVDYLDGEPGVRSARFAGEPSDDRANNRKLISLMKECPDEQRSARFRCVMVLRMSKKIAITGDGVCEGRILSKPRGSGGFGYDPLFVPSGFSQSFAELDSATKNLISHRGNALSVIRERLQERIGTR